MKKLYAYTCRDSCCVVEVHENPKKTARRGRQNTGWLITLNEDRRRVDEWAEHFRRSVDSVRYRVKYSLCLKAESLRGSRSCRRLEDNINRVQITACNDALKAFLRLPRVAA